MTWGGVLSWKESYLLRYVVSFARVWQTFVPSWQGQGPWGGSGGRREKGSVTKGHRHSADRAPGAQLSCLCTEAGIRRGTKWAVFQVGGRRELRGNYIFF